MTNSRIVFFVLAAILSGLSSRASAEQFCVSTASEFATALVVSQFIDESNEIRVQQGTYNMPDGSGPSDGYRTLISNLTISGGWNSGCTSRSLDPLTTTINGQGNDSAFWGLVSNASMTLDGLRFISISGIQVGDRSDVQCPALGQKLIVRRVRIENSVEGSFTAQALWIRSRCHEVRVENTLVVGGVQSGLVMDCFANMRYQVINSTVRDTANSSFSALEQPNGPCVADSLGLNQIINSALERVTLYGVSPLALNNIFDELVEQDGAEVFPGSSNNLIGNPQLDADYRPIEPGSPAINAGQDVLLGGLPATDISGSPRVVGLLPDIGAFESSVSNLFALTVTSSSDSGPGSLRSIIDQANASPGLNLIQFDIPGACPRIITLSSPLPNVTDDLIINGFSQPGANLNTLEFGNNSNLCVGLRGSQLNDVPYALRVLPAATATLKVRGIGFGGYDEGGGLVGEAAIYLQGGSGHEIQGNQFGGPFHSTTLGVNSEAIRLMNSATGALIGGSSPANRNTISSSSLAGIHIIGSESGGHEIINNYIGTDSGGVSAVGNNDGIRLIQSSDNTILDNLISGNSRDGIYISGSEATVNLIAGNLIGGRRDGLFLCGVPPFPACPPTMTNRKGIFIENDAFNNTIGAGGAQGAPNQIRFSTQHGIRILSGQRNRLLSNSLWDNGTVSNEYEIDLGSFGLNPVDSDCAAGADLLANRGQNRPVLDAARTGSSLQTVVFDGSLSSCTNDEGFSSVYRLQFFVSDACDANGHGPGQRFIGDLNVVMPGPVQTDAIAVFESELAHPFLELGGRYLTATATDLFGNSSEFSNCVQIIDDRLFADRFEQ